MKLFFFLSFIFASTVAMALEYPDPTLFPISDDTCSAPAASALRGGRRFGGSSKANMLEFLSMKEKDTTKGGPNQTISPPLPTSYVSWAKYPVCSFASAENQRDCNSCWAWSVVASLQQQKCMKSNLLPMISISSPNENNFRVDYFDMPELMVFACTKVERDGTEVQGIAFKIIHCL